MSDEGYTLVEMLAALAIIGLAFGGLVESGRVIGQLQASALHSTRDLNRRVAVGQALRDLLQDSGPFLSDGVGGFDGTPSHFSFDCGEQSRCGARLAFSGRSVRLVTTRSGKVVTETPLSDDATFGYTDQTGAAGVWPPDDHKITALRAITISVERDRSGVLANARVAVDEPANCTFDMVSLACRRLP